MGAQATDFVLPVAGDAGAAARVRSWGHGEPVRTGSSIAFTEMERIVALSGRGGHDFSAYKRDTLLRLIERRMALHRIERLGDYAAPSGETTTRSMPSGRTG